MYYSISENIFGKTKKINENVETLVNAESLFINLMVERYLPENIENFRNYELKKSPWMTEETYTEYKNTIHTLDEDDIILIAFRDFVYTAFIIMKENFISLKPLSKEELETLNILTPAVMDAIDAIYEDVLGIDKDFKYINEFIPSDIYIYQILKSICDVDPNLIKSVHFFPNSISKPEGSRLIMEDEMFTYKYIKHCVRLAFFNTKTKADLHFACGNPIHIFGKALYECLGNESLEFYSISPTFHLKAKRIFSTDAVLYYLYDFCTLHSLLVLTNYTENIPSEILKIVSMITLHASYILSEYYLEQSVINSKDNYYQFYEALKEEISEWDCMNKEDILDKNKLDKLKELKKRVKELRTRVYEKEKLNTTCEKLLYKEIEVEEIIEQKVSSIISFTDKLRLLNDKQIVIITGRSLDTSRLGSNFKVMNAMEYKNRNVNLNVDAVVLLATTLPHSVMYDVQSDLSKDKTILIFSSRTNLDLIIMDILSQL